MIAVDISARPSKNVGQGFFSYLDQTLNVMSVSVLQNELGQADVVIKPQVLDLGAVGGFDQKSAPSGWARRQHVPHCLKSNANWRHTVIDAMPSERVSRRLYP